MKQNNHRSKSTVTESNRYRCESYRCRCYDHRPKAKTVTTSLHYVLPKLRGTEMTEKKQKINLSL